MPQSGLTRLTTSGTGQTEQNAPQRQAKIVGRNKWINLPGNENMFKNSCIR